MCINKTSTPLNVAHLHVSGPGATRQLPLRLELRKLGRVVGVGDASGPEAVPDGQRDVVLGADVEDLVPVLVGKVLLVVHEAQLGVDGPPSGDNASHALRSQGDVPVGQSREEGRDAAALKTRSRLNDAPRQGAT